MRPRFSWITGPAGISLRFGFAPRSLGTVLHTRLALSLDHSQGRPKMPLRAIPGTRCAWSEATSTIHRERPASVGLSLAFTKETWRASGDQAAKRILGSAGNPVTGF